MDNKITKKRLSNFLAYEWILTLIFVALGIFLLGLVYQVTSVQLTPGQTFKVFYDYGVYSNESFFNIADKDVLSFDIYASEERIQEANDVLKARLSIEEGDIIFTSTVSESEGGRSQAVRYIENSMEYHVTDFDNLLENGINYLNRFVKDSEKENLNAWKDYNNLDENKIYANFISRMKKDNRFRTEEQKRDGFEKEKLRIKKLCVVLNDFDYLLNEYDKNRDKLFFTHEYNGQVKTYGIDFSKLQKKSDKMAVNYAGRTALNVDENGTPILDEYGKETYVRTTEGVVVMAFGFYDEQPDLQYETVSYLTDLVKKLGDITLPSQT